MGRSYAGGRLGAGIWIYAVDGWQAGVGIGLFIYGLGAGINEKDLAVGQIYSCRLWAGIRIDGFVLFWMDWFVRLQD